MNLALAAGLDEAEPLLGQGSVARCRTGLRGAL